MREGATFLAFWGALLVALAIGLGVWSGGPGPALLLGQGGLLLLALALLQARRPPASRPRLLPGLSLPTAVLALGGAAAALGLTAGLWLILVGAEIALFGAVWLGHELWEERRWRG